MNKVHLIGRFAADPELKKTGSGIAVTSFTIAVDRPGTFGENRKTDWIDIVAWRNTAEFVCKYFSKGDPIIIDEGHIETRVWEDKAGQKRKSVEIVAESVMFVPKAKDSTAREAAKFEEAVPEVPKAEEFTVVDDEDLPF